MPETTTPDQAAIRRRGGAAFHKVATCRCAACVSRRGKAEAAALAARGKRKPGRPRWGYEEILDADLPAIIAPAKRTPASAVKEWIAMRLEDPKISNEEVAKRLNIASRTLRAYIARGTREGWLKFDDPINRIEFEIVPKVLDNLNLFLDQKDKTVTIETAKGTVFKQWQEAKGVNENPNTIIALKIEMAPENELSPKVITGHVVGKARELEE